MRNISANVCYLCLRSKVIPVTKSMSIGISTLEHIFPKKKKKPNREKNETDKSTFARTIFIFVLSWWRLYCTSKKWFTTLLTRWPIEYILSNKLNWIFSIYCYCCCCLSTFSSSFHILGNVRQNWWKKCRPTIAENITKIVY